MNTHDWPSCNFDIVRALPAQPAKITLFAGGRVALSAATFCGQM
jgi:hypothetical protein